jgi:16S rRNA U1498 N3-methylase RsmE
VAHALSRRFAELIEKAAKLGATALVALQLAQSQFQWNQRTSLLATAIHEAGAQAAAHSDRTRG